MSKFDHYNHLPTIFKKNKLSILPITRGTYLIARFDAYYKLYIDPKVSINYIPFPEHLESLDHQAISSESIAISCAYVSGIFDDFLNDEELTPTVNGRMGSGDFHFEITNIKKKIQIPVSISKAQIEIDAGYEGLHYLSLIEAKNSLPTDFLIRQLYYPFRLWTEKITKPVKSIFLVYSNSIFYLYEYQFSNINQYNSITLLKHKKYSFEPQSITLLDIQDILNTTKPIPELNIPFPQADSFERVINLCELLQEHESLARENVTSMYDFNVRQTNYYTDAGRYLGLIEKDKGESVHYTLTPKGKFALKQSYKNRQTVFIKAILEHSVFAESLKLYLVYSEIPSKDQIVAIMKKSNLYNIGADKTYYRRASTIISWINWILSLLDET